MCSDRVLLPCAARLRSRSSGSNTGSPKPTSGLPACILAGEHAQRLEARHRRQHADGLPLDQPGGVAIGREVARRLDVRHRHRRLLRHQQMERQRRERARGHHDEMALVLDQRLDRAEQRSHKARARGRGRTARVGSVPRRCTRCARGRDPPRRPARIPSPAPAAFDPRQSALVRLGLRAFHPLQSAMSASTSSPRRNAATFSASACAPSGMVFHSKPSRVSAKT